MDALMGRVPGDASITTVHLAACDATWIDLPDADPERVLLYLHGGAFIMETPRIHTMLVGKLCRGTRARGFMVAYRLAPEHKFPAAVDDCLAAYRHLLESGHAPDRIMIAGDSAGGNLALATLLAARDAGLAEIWHDMPHTFPAFPILVEAREAIARICAFLNARWEGRASRH